MKDLITPCLTPFLHDGSVDFQSLTALVRKLDESSVTGIFPLGSTGVFPWLTLEEKKKVVEVVRDSTSKPVYAGVSSTSIAESIQLSKHAADCGCEFAVLTTPYYLPADDEGKREFLTEVMDKSDLDFFLYNIPQFTGNRITPILLEEMIQAVPNLAGIKDSSGDMRYFSRLVSLRKNGFRVLQGQDDLLLPSLAIGGDGGVCGLSNLSDDTVRIMESFFSGKLSEAAEMQEKQVNPLMDVLNSTTFPSGYYYAFYLINRLEGGYRPPMHVPGSDSAAKIRESFKKSVQAR